MQAVRERDNKRTGERVMIQSKPTKLDIKVIRCVNKNPCITHGRLASLIKVGSRDAEILILKQFNSGYLVRTQGKTCTGIPEFYYHFNKAKELPKFDRRYGGVS